jgi:DNA (cytosine-5)-methyltransferase 1
MVAKHRVFSFFSGSGLLDLAFEKADFEVCFVNEYFQPFADAYSFSRRAMGMGLPKHGVHVCSIEDFLSDKKSSLHEMVRAERRDDSTIGFIGGPPCPDFSIAGKNRGEFGENGRLSKSYFQLILDVQPDWFVFENVKGLYRTKKHREFFEEMKASLSKSYNLSERLFNSIEAGAPQDRDRIILFGVRKKFASAANVSWEDGLKFPRRKAFEDYPWVETTEFKRGSHLPKPNNIPAELTVQHWFDKNEVTRHPNNSDCFRPKGGLAKFQVIAEGDVSRKSSKRLHRWRYSPTAAYGNNEVHLHPYEVRRINVAEALAIQSMPKDFVLPPYMTLSNKFKTVGNGVPFLLGLHIAEKVKEFLNQNA